MKPNNLRHLIFVRYNLGLYTDNVYKIENPDEYMEKRLPFFKRMLQSLADQTVKGFEVLVSVDERTPVEMSKAILDCKSIYPFTIIHENHSKYTSDLEIKEEWLLTSRIDNDDEYYPEFIETLYKWINEHPRQEIILDAKGVKVKDGKHSDTNRNHPNSPFISLLEPSKQRKTVFYGKGHSYAPMEFKCRFISNQALTKVHVHGSNAFYK